jgi:hypothetical protein
MLRHGQDDYGTSRRAVCIFEHGQLADGRSAGQQGVRRERPTTGLPEKLLKTLEELLIKTHHFGGEEPYGVSMPFWAARRAMG